MKLSQLHPNEGQIAGVPKNPRYITEKDFKALKKSLTGFRKMLALRPIVIDEGFNILGGNMRYRALVKLAEEHAKVGAFEFTDEIPDEWIKQDCTLTEKEKREFVLKDNDEKGDWDLDIIYNEFNTDELKDWDLNLPELKETQRLSALEFEGIYYQPREQPQIKLQDCCDLTKFNAKLKALDEFNLPQETKDVLKLFAYRFIKIDFESVANYYAFNATDEEKKAIERLRLVLVDGAINGFIEDDMLRVAEFMLSPQDMPEGGVIEIDEPTI